MKRIPIKQNRIFQFSMTVLTFIALAPFLFWIINPKTISYDPGGNIFESAAKILFTFTVLPLNQGSSYFLHFMAYFLMTSFAFGASLLSLILVWKSSSKIDARLLSMSLTGTIIFTGYHYLISPYKIPSFFTPIFEGISKTIIPVNIIYSGIFAIGLASFLRFFITFPRPLTKEDISVFVVENKTRLGIIRRNLGYFALILWVLGIEIVFILENEFSPLTTVIILLLTIVVIILGIKLKIPGYAWIFLYLLGCTVYLIFDRKLSILLSIIIFLFICCLTLLYARLVKPGFLRKQKNENLPKRIKTGHNFLQFIKSRYLWPAFFIPIVAETVLTGSSVFFPIWIGIITLLGSYWLARISFNQSTSEDRKRIIWIFNGFSTIFYVQVIISILPFALKPLIGSTGDHLYFAFSPYGIGLFIMGFIFVIFLWIAVFYSGAIDPSLIIRKVSLIGLIGGIFLFLFGGLTMIFSDIVIAQTGLPANTGGLLAGGTIAIAFRPVKGKVKKRIDIFFDKRIPITILAESPRRNAFVVFSDLVGYTKISSLDENLALKLLALFHKTALRISYIYHGRLVKTIGDAVLIEFKDSKDTLSGILELIRTFNTTSEIMGLPIQKLRTGVHYGEVVQSKDGDIFGDTVNIASRLQGYAKPDQVIISESVAQSDGLEASFVIEPKGPVELRNVSKPVVCYLLKNYKIL